MRKLNVGEVIEKGDEYMGVANKWYEVPDFWMGRSVDKVGNYRRPSNSQCIIKKDMLTKEQQKKLLDNGAKDMHLYIRVRSTDLYKLLPQPVAKHLHTLCKENGSYIAPTNQKAPKNFVTKKTLKTVANSWVYKNLKAGETISYTRHPSDLIITVRRGINTVTDYFHSSDNANNVTDKISKNLDLLRG